MNNTAHIIYQGTLRTEAMHLQSGNRIITDAPTDNHGKGEAFSPTDLVATALGSCMLTIMGIKADSLGIDITGTSVSVQKIMETSPRRIGEIIIEIVLPTGIDAEILEKLKDAAHTCPVAKSLHPDLKQTIRFIQKKIVTK